MSAMLQVKVVPGARRDEVAGKYGEGIKVRVSAPPEAGKANAAVVEVVAGLFGVKASAVRIVRGQTNPRKTVSIDGVDQAQVDRMVAELQ
jgi:uncharacterized protein (TIGR00251 family)